ncbi:MAG: hypothetical protein ACRC50_14375 [Gaiella sp.]
MSSLEERDGRDGFTAVDGVAGFLATASFVLSALAMGLGFVLALDAHPARTAAVAVILAIVAALMSERFQPLAQKAMLFAAFAWVVGMTIAVLTEAPLI